MRGVAQRQLRTSALGAHDEDYEGSRLGGDMANGEDDGTPEPIRIDVLSPHLASEAGDLLAASHADYPSFTHLFPDPPRRRRVLRPFMSAAARDAALHARAMAASDDNGIVGVALWLPQGAYGAGPPASSPFGPRRFPGIRARRCHPGESSPPRQLMVPASHGRPSTRPTPWRRKAAALPYTRSRRRGWPALSPAHLGSGEYRVLRALRVRGQPACHRGVRTRISLHRHDPVTKDTALRIANAPSCTIFRT